MSNILLEPDERLDIVNEKITLIQKKDGLTFGTDAFLLASFIKPYPSAHAVEFGTGTGIISLLLAARNRFKKISAVEIQEEFALLAERNIKYNSLDGICNVLCRDALSLKPSDIGGEADVVFCNPPYMKTDSGKRNENDFKYIARHEACGNINDFCASAFRLLKHGGKFYVVWRPDRLTDLFFALRSNRLEPKIITFVHADSTTAPSLVLISATKGGASGSITTPPLLLYREDGNKSGGRPLSAVAEQIYRDMSFEALF